MGNERQYENESVLTVNEFFEEFERIKNIVTAKKSEKKDEMLAFFEREKARGMISTDCPPEWEYWAPRLDDAVKAVSKALSDYEYAPEADKAYRESSLQAANSAVASIRRTIRNRTAEWYETRISSMVNIGHNLVDSLTNDIANTKIEIERMSQRNASYSSLGYNMVAKNPDKRAMYDEGIKRHNDELIQLQQNLIAKEDQLSDIKRILEQLEAEEEKLKGKKAQPKKDQQTQNQQTDTGKKGEKPQENDDPKKGQDGDGKQTDTERTNDEPLFRERRTLNNDNFTDRDQARYDQLRDKYKNNTIKPDELEELIVLVNKKIISIKLLLLPIENRYIARALAQLEFSDVTNAGILTEDEYKEYSRMYNESQTGTISKEDNFKYLRYRRALITRGIEITEAKGTIGHPEYISDAAEKSQYRTLMEELDMTIKFGNEVKVRSSVINMVNIIIQFIEIYQVWPTKGDDTRKTGGYTADDLAKWLELLEANPSWGLFFYNEDITVIQIIEQYHIHIIANEPVFHTVTFDTNGGTLVGDLSQVVKDGDRATKPINDPELDNEHEFECWTLDGQEFDFNTPVTGDITLVAKYREKTLAGGLIGGGDGRTNGGNGNNGGNGGNNGGTGDGDDGTPQGGDDDEEEKKQEPKQDDGFITLRFENNDGSLVFEDRIEKGSVYDKYPPERDRDGKLLKRLKVKDNKLKRCRTTRLAFWQGPDGKKFDFTKPIEEDTTFRANYRFNWEKIASLGVGLAATLPPAIFVGLNAPLAAASVSTMMLATSAAGLAVNSGMKLVSEHFTQKRALIVGAKTPKEHLINFRRSVYNATLADPYLWDSIAHSFIPGLAVGAGLKLFDKLSNKEEDKIIEDRKWRDVACEKVIDNDTQTFNGIDYEDGNPVFHNPEITDVRTPDPWAWSKDTVYRIESRNALGKWHYDIPKGATMEEIMAQLPEGTDPADLVVHADWADVPYGKGYLGFRNFTDCFSVTKGGVNWEQTAKNVIDKMFAANGADFTAEEIQRQAASKLISEGMAKEAAEAMVEKLCSPTVSASYAPVLG